MSIGLLPLNSIMFCIFFRRNLLEITNGLLLLLLFLFWCTPCVDIYGTSTLGTLTLPFSCFGQMVWNRPGCLHFDAKPHPIYPESAIVWTPAFPSRVKPSLSLSLVLYYPPNGPPCFLHGPPRILIEVMMFHLNFPHTILEPYSNTAKIFPFQSKRKKSVTCFIMFYIAFPQLSLLMFLISFLTALYLTHSAPDTLL